MITLGVEEEYLLLDPATALPVPLADEVRAVAGIRALATREEVKPELLQAQLEVATPVCAELAEAGGHLLRLRHAVGAAAAEAGCRAIASGAAPLADALAVPVTPDPRYLQLRGQGRRLIEEQLVNGMHIHVSVPDRATGVAVLNRLRTWLPLLVAMAGNSPLWRGQDTGFASWRTVVYGRWPVSGPPPEFTDGADYDRRVNALVRAGAIGDTRQVYWHVRLSDRYPTVEVRCFDVQLTAEEAVMFAGIVRGLTATALREHADGVPHASCPPEMLSAANWHAARYGLGGRLVTPDGHCRPAGDLVAHLLDHITPALDEYGDTREVTSLLHRFLQHGEPATRQRQALASGGIQALVDLIGLHAGDG
ncbi:glutamate--cysteine ligase [Streptomyces sp. I05A-00742]|uniref:carboxylate-amine ligase n=1 Tax=Streptomyces sp. I05A-00742 TaxID=2732853 RepID=UPI0014883E4D|nr:glutamate--cysteine ligase [Streptomyces sp. I05A-00742]